MEGSEVTVVGKETKDTIIPEILLPTGTEDVDIEEEVEEWEDEGGGRKVRLVRSHAIRDSTSPPLAQQTSSPVSPGKSNEAITSDQRSIVSGSETGEGTIGELADTASVSDCGRGDTDTPDESQYTDSTGIDLAAFIISTLNKNTKDRMLMLKLETDMTTLVKDPKKSHHKFPQMSSYHRMLVHRVAAYFGLDHNVDQTGNCVIVNKTKTTRLPDMKFKDHVPDDLVLSTPEPKRLILKRESCSCDSGDRYSDNSSRRSKSIEEREEEYERAKRRIFNDAGRDHHMQAYKYPINLGSTKGAVQARSFDIRDSLRDSTDRPQVSKSFSFGGYPAVQPLEPHRSGHKSNPPTLNRGQAVWAVSDFGMVPKGSVLINPDTGTPYLNSDGSVYLFDPGHPPRFAHEESPAPSPLHLHQELGKMSLEEKPTTATVVYPGGWMVPHQPPRPQPQPYILVNPVSSLPQYLPYMYPSSYQENSSSTDLSLTQQQQQPAQQRSLAQTPVLAAQPPQGAPLAVAAPQPVMNQQQPGAQPPAMLGGAPAVHTPVNHQNGLLQTIQQGQYQYIGHPVMNSVHHLQKPFLFSIHRSPTHSILFMQHCPALLSRSQLTGMLDPLLAGRGHVQYLDPTSQWNDINTLPPDAPTTNRYPIQIVFDSEDQASQTIVSLKAAGFIMEPQD